MKLVPYFWLLSGSWALVSTARSVVHVWLYLTGCTSSEPPDNHLFVHQPFDPATTKVTVGGSRQFPQQDSVCPPASLLSHQSSPLLPSSLCPFIGALEIREGGGFGGAPLGQTLCCFISAQCWCSQTGTWWDSEVKPGRAATTAAGILQTLKDDEGHWWFLCSSMYLLMIKQSHNLIALVLLLYSLVCLFLEVILVHFKCAVVPAWPFISQGLTCCWERGEAVGRKDVTYLRSWVWLGTHVQSKQSRGWHWPWTLAKYRVKNPCGILMSWNGRESRRDDEPWTRSVVHATF